MGKQVELLAPAGTLETLRAVANAGADAVYAAGTKFGARAYAGNLSDEELLSAIDFLHLHGKKFYLAVNTLLKDDELKGELLAFLTPLYEQGLDGAIVQDLGVLWFLREQFPGLALHASTQMTITGPFGARLLKEMGCCRVIPARELTLAELSAIHEQVDIEIEAFVHGALCFCYSGQCLMSSMLGGRSGNRGRCAQPCRLPYQANGAVGHYLFSMKDLCAISFLPELLENGVCSLKIEGRMKQLEYAAGVTSIYREYLDRYLSHPEEHYEVSSEDQERLLALGSRSGFTKGYFYQKHGPSMMAMEKPSHEKEDGAIGQEMRDRFAGQGLKEKVSGTLTLLQGKPAEFTVQCKDARATVTGEDVQPALKSPLREEAVRERMAKMGNSEFVLDSLSVEMGGETDGGIFLPAGELNRLRRDAIAALEQEMLRPYRRKMQDVTLWQSRAEAWYKAQEKDAMCGQGTEQKQNREEIQYGTQEQDGQAQPTFCLAVSVRTLEQGLQVLECPFVWRIDIGRDAFGEGEEARGFAEFARDAHGHGKQAYYQMPIVLRGNSIRWHLEAFQELARSADGFVAGNLEAVGLLLSCGYPAGRILADASLYVMNGEACWALRELGITRFTLPLEANEKELRHRGFPGGELLLYGYLPLMVSAQCVQANLSQCTKSPGVLPIKDRYGKTFWMERRCRECCNVLYNTVPLSLLHQGEAVSRLGAESFRISFTLEDAGQIQNVLSYYERGILRGEPFCEEPLCSEPLHGKPLHVELLRGEQPQGNRYLKDFTNGHFKRGVD